MPASAALLPLLLLVNCRLRAVAQTQVPSECTGEGWVYSSSSSICYFISNQLASYVVASSECSKMSAAMATLYGPEELPLMQQLFKQRAEAGYTCDDPDNCMDFWIGMTHSSPNVTRLENWYWTNLTFRVKEELRPYLATNTRRCGAMRLLYIAGYMSSTFVEDNCDQLLRFICKKVVSCPDGYATVPGADNCYKIVPRLMNFTEAEAACRYQGRAFTGNLAIIPDEAHGNAITRWLREQADKTRNQCFEHDLSDSRLWIGAQRNIKTNCSIPYTWRLGASFEMEMKYKNWHQPELHLCSLNKAYCVYIQKRYNWQWVDEACSDGRHCPLCQRYP